MSPTVILALISDLYEQNAVLQHEVAQLRAALQPEPKDDEPAPAG